MVKAVGTMVQFHSKELVKKVVQVQLKGRPYVRLGRQKQVYGRPSLKAYRNPVTVRQESVVPVQVLASQRLEVVLALGKGCVKMSEGDAPYVGAESWPVEVSVTCSD